MHMALDSIPDTQTKGHSYQVVKKKKEISKKDRLLKNTMSLCSGPTISSSGSVRNKKTKYKESKKM